jgi:TPR repeat protein
MSWFRKLLGHTAAQSEEQRMAEALGAWQAGDHGVALDLWAPLAQAGVARAQSNMGAAFLQGQGVERDPDKAVAWLRRAADQGDAGAQRNLALCHYEAGACRRTRPWRWPGMRKPHNRVTATPRTCCRG